MDKNAILAMVLVMVIAAGMMLAVVAILVVLYKHNKASEGMHLCEFTKVGGGSYTKLLPIDADGLITPPAEHTEKYSKLQCYVTDKMHTFIAQWPEGWPRPLQTKVGKSYFEEGFPEPMMPAMRDKQGNILGLRNVLTGDMLFNLKKSKVGSELRGYGDRERELTNAMKNYLRPIIFYVVSGVLALLLIASIVIQWQGNQAASKFYSQYTVTGVEKGK